MRRQLLPRSATTVTTIRPTPATSRLIRPRRTSRRSRPPSGESPCEAELRTERERGDQMDGKGRGTVRGRCDTSAASTLPPCRMQRGLVLLLLPPPLSLALVLCAANLARLKPTHGTRAAETSDRGEQGREEQTYTHQHTDRDEGPRRGWYCDREPTNFDGQNPKPSRFKTIDNSN